MEISFTTSTLIVLLSTVSGWLANILTSYFSEKGKNAATKEDIGIITQIVEDVRTKIALETEKQKIVYGGVYKEKIEICKELLRRTYQLKRAVENSAIAPELNTFDNEVEKELTKMLENTRKVYFEYYDFYKTSRPFLSDKIIEAAQQISQELFNCFYDFENPFRYRNFNNPDFKAKMYDKFYAAYEKLFTTDFFEQLANIIVDEIKKDLELMTKGSVI